MRKNLLLLCSLVFFFHFIDGNQGTVCTKYTDISDNTSCVEKFIYVEKHSCSNQPVIENRNCCAELFNECKESERVLEERVNRLEEQVKSLTSIIKKQTNETNEDHATSSYNISSTMKPSVDATWNMTATTTTTTTTTTTDPNGGIIDKKTSKKFNHKVVLDSNNDVYLYWRYNESYITFEIVAKTNGWVGVGISPNGGMAGSDIVVGWVKNGQAFITDRHGGKSNGFPRLDPKQNVVLLSGRERDGWTSIKFQRQIASCEGSFDLPITADTLKIIWALGPNDPEEDVLMRNDIHGAGKEYRGVKSLILLDNPGVNEAVEDEHIQSFEILNDNFLIPAIKTYYNCRLIEMPKFSAKQHIVKIQPVIEAKNEAIVHHIVLYQCKYKIVETFYYPSHAGFPLGDEDSPKYVIMETHYDNPERKPGIVDNSGLKIHYTSQLRKYDAGVIQIGHKVDPFRQLIPPKAYSYLQYGECHSDCMAKGMNYINRKKIQLFATLLHSHLLGRKLTLRHIKSNGTELPYIAQDNSYDFNYQETRSFEKEIVFEAGDTMQMICDYNSKHRQNVTSGGLGTQEEMCLSFVYYYPKMPVTKCESYPHDALSYFRINSFKPTVYPSVYMTLDDAIVTSPREHLHKSISSVVNSINWNQERAKEMSHAMKNMNLEHYCETTKNIGIDESTEKPSIEIKEEYQSLPLICKNASGPDN